MNFKMSSILRITHPVIIYPLLMLVLFILTKIQLYKVNPAWQEILLFFTLNLIALILGYIILNSFIKDRQKAWLIDFLIFGLVLFYNKIEMSLDHLKILESDTSNHWHIVLVILIIVLAGLSILILRYRGSLHIINQYLNFVLCCLIVYQLYVIVEHPDTRKIKLVSHPEIVSKINDINTDSLPDIYYIILDAYTSNQSLKEYWDFNNQVFENFLTGKGFKISSNSKTNYNMTPFSLASSLNMSYLTRVPNSEASSANEKNLTDLVGRSSVVEIFSKNNYEISDYSFFDVPGYPRYYNDYFFLLKKNLIEGTLYEHIIGKFNKNWNQLENADLLSLNSINLDILNKLTVKIPNRSKPRFVYAHIMMPHEPYLFDEFGNTQKGDSALDYYSKNKYLGQLKYVNKLVENTISKIFDNYFGKLPVIIIQGDHGWRYLKGENQLKESTTIFNAFFFPDHDYRKIYSSISPVNTFRVIFNKYLHYNLELLNDTTYNVFVF